MITTPNHGFASLDAPSTAYRHDEGPTSAEQNQNSGADSSHQMQYIHNIQNRMGMLDRSIDKILNVITTKAEHKPQV